MTKKTSQSIAATKNLTRVKKSVEVKMTVINIFQMDNKLKMAFGGAALLTLGAQAQAETVDEAQARLAQLVAATPEAIVKVIQSGEGCDASILNTALETDNYLPYEQCSLIEQTRHEVKLAQTHEALEEENNAVADLTDKGQKLDQKLQEQGTAIAVLTKKKQEIGDQLLGNVLN